MNRYMTNTEPAVKQDRSGRMRTACFLAGLVGALIGCSLLGSHTSSTNIFRDFGRFHVRLAPDSFYLPTARQVRQLAFEQLDRFKVNVVVGGSSVFYGVGQPAGRSLADNIRRELGDGFRLINLAMRGGDVSGIAELTTEMLVREGYRTIYLADIGIGTNISPIGTGPYHYFYWDAKARGYPIDWPARDAALDKFARFSDPALGAKVNSFANCSELWSTVGYEYLFTVFSSLVPERFWSPRRRFSDNEPDPSPEARYRFIDQELAIIRGISKLRSAPQWDAFRASIDVALPPTIRPITILALCENSSWLMAQVAEEFRKNRRRVRETAARLIGDSGVTPVVPCEGLEKDDYIDRTHLSVDGAAKVGPRVAQAIRLLAQRNGWAQ